VPPDRNGRLAALSKIAIIIAAKGGAVDGITVGDCVQLLEIAAQTRTGADRHASSPFFYQLLHARGAFGPGAQQPCGCSPAAASRRASS